jgi:hypothetical protein
MSKELFNKIIAFTWVGSWFSAFFLGGWPAGQAQTIGLVTTVVWIYLNKDRYKKKNKGADSSTQSPDIDSQSQ